MEATRGIAFATVDSPDDSPDKSLAPWVIAAQSGDREAFGVLVERVWLPLVRLARSILAPAGGDAEDLVQEALIHAWSKLPSLRKPEAFRPWLHRSVARRCYREARRPAQVELQDQPVDPPTHLERDVERMLRYLTPRQRSVFYLSTIEGWNDGEIALHLGMLPPTVRVHRMQARRRLRQLLEEPK